MNNKMNIYSISIRDNISEDSFDFWVGKVSAEKKKKVQSFKLYDDKKRSVYGELLLRYILINDFEIKNEKIVINVDVNGKPNLKGNKDIFFNISHSGDYVVCVVDSHPIGIDIEKMDGADMQIAKRFFAEYEYKYLQRQENKVEMFYKLWTLKESYIKCTGKGLTVPLNSFEFEFTDEIIQLKIPRTNEFYFKSKKVFGNYYLSLCCVEQYKSMNIKQITYKELKDCLV